MSGADDAALIEAIQQVLPQTQCGQCSHKGCAPYAAAIARDGAPINRCPPGGDEGIARLAAITGREVLALDPACGVAAPRGVALIDEARCIGCTLCIQACPVDAIVGAPRRMHDVIADLCTGCALCLPPCPVDCISMSAFLPDGAAVPAWTGIDASLARMRFEARAQRLLRESAEAEQRLAGLHARVPALPTASPPGAGEPLAAAADALPATAPAEHAAPAPDDARKRAIVSAALERARQKAALRAAAAAKPAASSGEAAAPPDAA